MRTISKPVISHDIVKQAIRFRVVDRNAETEVGAELMRGVIHPNLTWDIAATQLETSKAI